MGNVFASSLAESPMPGTVPPPHFSEKNSAKDSSKFDNPGTFEELHKKCLGVFPGVFGDLRIVVNKILSNHFQISHSIIVSSLHKPGRYRFGATYVGSKQMSPMEAYPILSADIDPSGNMNANIIHQFNNSLRTKFFAQVQDNKFIATQLAADYIGSSYTASITLGNTDILNRSGVTVLHYLQNVTPSLALGTEMAYQYGPQVPGGKIAVPSIAGRYTGKNFVISGTLGSASLHACYYRKENEHIQVGVEVETNLRLQESVCSLGYQVDLPKGNVVFRGMIDSNWTVGAVLERKLALIPCILSLSGMINHTTGQSRLGIGLNFGG